jgi:hypothetical protein
MLPRVNRGFSFLWAFRQGGMELIQEDNKRLSYKLVEVPGITGLSRTFWRNEHYAGRLRTKYANGAVIVLAADLKAYLENLPEEKPSKQEDVAGVAA